MAKKKRTRKKKRKTNSVQSQPFNVFNRLDKRSGVHPFSIFKNNKIVTNKSNMTYEMAKRRYPKLSPFDDSDKDGIINLFDCYPFNPNKQGKQHKRTKRKTSIAESDIQKYMKKYKRVKKRLKSIEEKEKKARKKAEYTKAFYEAGYGLPKKLVEETKELAEIEKIRKDIEGKRLKKEAKKAERRIKREGILERTGVRPTERFVSRRAGEVKKALETRYGRKAQVLSGRAKVATLGTLSAITQTGGIGDTGEELVGVGVKGGLSQIERRTTGSTRGAGRPHGTYKYGIPIDEYQEFKSKQERELRIQKEIEKQKLAALELEKLKAQVQGTTKDIQQLREEPEQRRLPVPPQQGPSMPLPPEDNLNYIEGIEDQFVIDPREQERVRQEAARRIRIEQFRAEQQPVVPRPGVDTSQYSKIQQPEQQNPWNLRARWRPNLAQNRFKKQDGGLLTKGIRLLGGGR